MTTEPEIQVFPDGQALIAATAELIVTQAQAAAADHDRFSFALSGGSTPRALYQALAQSPLRERMPWQHTLLFWGDERYVPPDAPDSNQRMAREAMIDHVPIPPTNVYPPPISGDPIADAASYETTLRTVLPGTPPRLDLVLLGMGADGHTASLFPGTAALAEQERLFVANRVEQLSTWRLTMTFPLLNNAALALFLVSGADKAEMIRRVLRPEPGAAPFPCQLIRPHDGRLLWMLDSAAAALL